jgi:probable rRNA maturation factor
MLVHSALHAQGFEHETDAEAQAMQALEQAVMARLGFDDPYAV